MKTGRCRDRRDGGMERQKDREIDSKLGMILISPSLRPCGLSVLLSLPRMSKIKTAELKNIRKNRYEEKLKLS
jgi:hypothetical protein